MAMASGWLYSMLALTRFSMLVYPFDRDAPYYSDYHAVVNVKTYGAARGTPLALRAAEITIWYSVAAPNASAAWAIESTVPAALRLNPLIAILSVNAVEVIPTECTCTVSSAINEASPIAISKVTVGTAATATPVALSTGLVLETVGAVVTTASKVKNSSPAVCVESLRATILTGNPSKPSLVGSISNGPLGTMLHLKSVSTRPLNGCPIACIGKSFIS